MADVEVKCEACGAPVTLSEYAAMETISCRICGAALRARPSSSTNTVNDRLKLRQTEPLPPPPVEPVDKSGKLKRKGEVEKNAEEREAWRFERYIEQSRSTIKHKPKSTSLLLSWVCFLVLAGGMAYVRYLNGCPPSYLAMLKTYGPYAALLMHVIILLTAFKDTVFQGILCLLIPGYSFFYLFLVSDNFWMRAVIGGTFVGIAQDSAFYYRDVGLEVYKAVTHYIASGG